MRSHVLLFIAFADSFGFLDFPVGARTLLAFGEFLLRTYRAPKSVLNAFASLRHFSLDFNLDVSAFQERSVLLWRRALPLTCRHSVSQAPPITLELLERLCLLSDRLGEAGLVFAGLLALLFATMARLSSFLPQYGRAFDRTRQPTFIDVRRKGGIWHIFIKWAKAHQDTSMGYWVPISPRLGSPACPVTRWLQLRQLAGGLTASGPLFWSRGSGSGGSGAKVPLSMSLAREWLRILLARLGQSDQGYTFHSLRRGACTLAFLQGATEQDIRRLGGWRSEAVQEYLPVEASRGRAARALAAPTFFPPH